MKKLTNEGVKIVQDMSNRYGVSDDAVKCILQALVNSGGAMAQFNHPELGGGGQWMQGGMTMSGDMFNHQLTSTINGLCGELSALLGSQAFQQPSSSQQQNSGGYGQQQQSGNYQQNRSYSSDEESSASKISLFVPSEPGKSNNWWPEGLGVANSTGGQNNVRYAYFSGSHRIAVEVNGAVTVYDSLDHEIGGFSQQQGTGSSITFSSQRGVVDLGDLPIVHTDGVGEGKVSAPRGANAPQLDLPFAEASLVGNVDVNHGVIQIDIISSIERLAVLRDKGILTDDEFVAKKTELLAKL